MKRYYRWRSLTYPSYGYMSSIGIYYDDTLWNPNGYPEDVVRAAVLWADEHKRLKIAENRKKGAQQAAVTRQRRHELKVQAIVKKMLRDESVGPSTHCVLCKKQLSDPQSLARGIGSECWQGILSRVEQARCAETDGQ
jgi:hypothetical protein